MKTPDPVTARRLAQREKFLRKKIGQAIRDYRMIGRGDRICVAVSGGQDSLTVLKVLASKTLRKSFDYQLSAVYVKTDFEACHSAGSLLDGILKTWGVPLYVREADVVSNSRRKDFNCFWCAWNKRKAIFEAADGMGCNKIVLGHHKDDIVETTLLNLFFNGEISTMNPRQEMFGGKLAIIRPLCYVEKKEIAAFAKLSGFLSATCTCPFGEDSKRKFVRDIIALSGRSATAVKSNIFRAPSRIRADYLGGAEAVDKR